MLVPRAVATSTGNSPSIVLGDGEHVLYITSSGWGNATLQIGNGSTFVNYKVNGSVVTLTSNDFVVVPGGQHYRLNVASYSQPITLNAVKAT